MKWEPSEIPGKKSRFGNMWEQTIPKELIRSMRVNPGITYKLLDNNGNSLRVTKADYSALMRSCPRPFRIQSRTIPKNNEGDRIVWVSMDPGHWAKHENSKKKSVT